MIIIIIIFVQMIMILFQNFKPPGSSPFLLPLVPLLQRVEPKSFNARRSVSFSFLLVFFLVFFCAQLSLVAHCRGYVIKQCFYKILFLMTLPMNMMINSAAEWLCQKRVMNWVTHHISLIASSALVEMVLWTDCNARFYSNIFLAAFCTRRNGIANWLHSKILLQ